VATLVAAITRPVGFFVIPLVIAAEWFYAGQEKRRSRALWVAFASIVAGAFLLHAYFFQDMRRWPSDFLRPKLQYYAAREKGGEVVWDRPETFRPPPVTMTDHVVLEADRFVRFFQVTTPGNSSRHNLVAIVYYLPLYLLALVAVVTAPRSGDRRRKAVVEVTLLWILALAAVSAAAHPACGMRRGRAPAQICRRGAAAAAGAIARCPTRATAPAVSTGFSSGPPSTIASCGSSAVLPRGSASSTNS
jgi:uncharacterized membrane protein